MYTIFFKRNSLESRLFSYTYVTNMYVRLYKLLMLIINVNVNY